MNPYLLIAILASGLFMIWLALKPVKPSRAGKHMICCHECGTFHEYKGIIPENYTHTITCECGNYITIKNTVKN